MKKNAGFTLIELLAVVSILLILGAVLLPAVFSARSAQIRKTAAAEIEAIKLAIEKYREDFGDYPPSYIDEIGDDMNHGNRALLISLATTQKRGPYLPTHLLRDSTRTRRVADYSIEDPQWAFEDNQLRELLDPWGSPYFYFHNRDYTEEQVTDVQRAAEELAPGMWELNAVRKEEVFLSPYSFQLWSAGPDTTNNDGENDDLTSWR